MTRLVVAACLLVSGCAAATAPPPVPPVPPVARTGPSRFWFPAHAQDGDLFCVPDGAAVRCRTVREIRAYVAATVNAAP